MQDFRAGLTPFARIGIGVIAGVVLLAGVVVVSWRFSPSRNETTPPDNLVAPSISDFISYTDVTSSSGIEFVCRNGDEAKQFTILETLGGGVGLLDFDGDGLLDVFFVGGGQFVEPDFQQLRGYPCKLYRNLGNWRFVDVTANCGIDRIPFYSHGVAVADYDRDGWTDLLVTGYMGLALFRNVAVDPHDARKGRRFEEVTQKVGLTSQSWFTSAGFGDVDGDGYPDLYVCAYVDWSFQNNPRCEGVSPGIKRDVCPPQKFKPLRHFLFHNVKGQQFLDVSDDHGFKAVGCGLGVVVTDLNDDGQPDFYVANDATNNLLFLNRNRKLEERGLASGVALDESGHYNGSMGVDAGDYDGSGKPSLWVTNFQGEVHNLYKNHGNGMFQEIGRATGIAAIGLLNVAFGTSFVDVDNDGWLDIVFVNGHVLHHPNQGSQFRQKPVLLHNLEHRGRRFFKDVSRLAGPFFDIPRLGRGLAVGDLDNDGWPDLVVSHTNSPVVLLRNEGTKRKQNWLGLALRGMNNRDVVGSTITVDIGQRRQTYFTKGGGSYLSANDSRILIGLGSAERIDNLTVKWSWGATQSWTNVTPNQYWALTEGKAANLLRPGSP